jgi:cystathionine beta-lyase
MTALATRLVHPPPVPGAAPETAPSSTPIYQTATFTLPAEGEGRWDYTRSGNPTRDVLEAQLAALDGATTALAYTSGMAAVTAVLRLARPGEAILAGSDLYGGTGRMLEELARHGGVAVRRVDPRDLEAVAAALTSAGPPVAVVFVETPTNPQLHTVDIEALARLLGALPGRRPLLAVDNSMLSPYWQRPLELGADLAVQSATKLLGGHGDLTAGVVAVADRALGERLAFLRNAEGTALPPFEAWLLLRGLETLAVRLERQGRTAARVAAFLREHPRVRRLYTAESETPGVVLSVETGSVELSKEILTRTRLFRTTVSFGSVTASISRPWAMSHASIPENARRAAGLTPELLRLSVGLEDPEDLLVDLETALCPDRARISAGSAGSRKWSGSPGRCAG